MNAHLTGGGAVMRDVDGKHVYGDGLPSASEILRIFSFGEGIDMNSQVMEDARNIGHQVHASIESFIKTGIMVVHDDMVGDDVRYKNCIQAFYGWHKGKHIIPIATEVRCVSLPLGFGGTIDIVAFIDGTLTIGDWKTGRIKFQDFIQLHLYEMLLKEIGIHAKDLILVALDKQTGEFKERRCPDKKKSRKFAKELLRFYKKSEEFKRLVDGRRKLQI